MKKFLYYIIGLIVVFSVAFGYILFGRTKVSIITPLFISLAASLLLWFVLKKAWSSLWPDCSSWLRLVLHVLIVTPVVFAGLLALNFYGSVAEGHKVEGTIVRKYTRENTRYRHVGRRNIPAGKTTSYYIEVMLPDSTVIEEMVNVNRYAKIRTGQKHIMTERKGALGFEIVDF